MIKVCRRNVSSKRPQIKTMLFILFIDADVYTANASALAVDSIPQITELAKKCK